MVSGGLCGVGWTLYDGATTYKKLDTVYDTLRVNQIYKVPLDQNVDYNFVEIKQSRIKNIFVAEDKYRYIINADNIEGSNPEIKFVGSKIGLTHYESVYGPYDKVLSIAQTILPDHAHNRIIPEYNHHKILYTKIDNVYAYGEVINGTYTIKYMSTCPVAIRDKMFLDTCDVPVGISMLITICGILL